MCTGPQHPLLCIDDNPVNGLLVQEYFQVRHQRPVQLASTGMQGLSLATEHPPCAVLLDLGLPDLPGLEVLARLRAHPATRDVPVAIVSATDDDRDWARARALGARACWSKPLDFRLLGMQLEALLAPPAAAAADVPAPPAPPAEGGAGR